jgi:hypothetical protein
MIKRITCISLEEDSGEFAFELNKEGKVVIIQETTWKSLEDIAKSSEDKKAMYDFYILSIEEC